MVCHLPQKYIAIGPGIAYGVRRMIVQKIIERLTESKAKPNIFLPGCPA